MIQPMAVKGKKKATCCSFFWLKGFFYHPGFSGTWGIDLVRVCPTCPWQVVLHFTYIRVIAFFSRIFKKDGPQELFMAEEKKPAIKNYITLEFGPSGNVFRAILSKSATSVRPKRFFGVFWTFLSLFLTFF